MTADSARKNYNDFVSSTAERIDGVIYRVKHNYNISKKMNSINDQSHLASKTFNQSLVDKGLLTPDEQS